MKLYIFSLFLALLATTVSAVAPQKAVIISYPPHTPDSVLRDAMNAIEEAGGVITHEYNLLKGFAAKASVKALETVTALGDKYPPVIETDQMVSIDGDVVMDGHLS